MKVRSVRFGGQTTLTQVISIAPIHIGCSGWNYRHWRGAFYPDGLPAKRWFDHYATVFDSVEINNSFYRVPEQSTFAKWRDQRRPASVMP